MCACVRASVHLDLLQPWPLEAKIEAVVGQRPDLHVVAVVAHADDGDLGILDEADHLLCEAPGRP